MTTTMNPTKTVTTMTTVGDPSDPPISNPPLAAQTRWWNLWDGVFTASCPHGDLVDWNAYLLVPMCHCAGGTDGAA
jgi:hypothetical protein